MVGGPSVVFTRRAAVYKTFERKSTNLCKSIVGIDASQLYPYSMCQPMPTGSYTRSEYDSETNSFTPRQKNTGLSRIWFSHIFKHLDQSVQLRVMLLPVDKKN